MFAGHLDQHGRVTGRLRIGTRELRVDCGSVRDRSWGPRVVRRDLRLGNAHGTGEVVRGGTLQRAGESARPVEGLRRTTWDGPWPLRVDLEAVDAKGRALHASGTCRNRRAVVANPELYAVLNLVEWHSEGHALWGENHDVWSRTAWTEAGRPPLEAGD